MAAFSTPQGYRCEFIESVPAEDFHCKLCSLVARALTITSCCGESHCRTCIDAVQQDGHPCPGCGEESFKVFPQVKYQQKIAKFQVYCTMKEKGCGWTGALEHLETHLDPDQGDCQYVDVNCPLKCDEKIEKRNIDQHMANKCVKRDHVCPYCSFKATYEMIRDTHWPECKYYPLVCPNRCGVTCERAEMEDHMNICRLEEVECEFSYAGCKERFRREEWEEHAKENSMKHLSMVATAAVKDRQEFQTKIEEQEKKFEFKLQEQKQQFEMQVFLLKMQYDFQDKTIKTLQRSHSYNFTLENFTEVKRRGRYWKSPPMYTHAEGYRFQVHIDTNYYGRKLQVEIWGTEGEYDDKLTWPFRGDFTILLINHCPGGNDWVMKISKSWNRPGVVDHSFRSFAYTCIEHEILRYDEGCKIHYLKNNSLQFRISDITLRN